MINLKIVKNKIKQLYDWTCYDKQKLKKNQELKNTTIGKCAFILATGPSIKQFDLSKLAGLDCFSISNFYLHKDINKIKPVFHFFAPFHYPLNLESYIQWLKEADSKLPKETKICLGHTDENIVKNNCIFPTRDIYYTYLGSSNFKNIDLCKAVPAPQTGVHMIFNMLFYMGYSEIYLIGCDANFMKYYGGKRENFYNSDQDIRKNASDTEVWGGIIEAFQYEIITHRIYQKYYNERGFRNIVNLSKDSWIEVFPKGDFDEIIKKYSI